MWKERLTMSNCPVHLFVSALVVPMNDSDLRKAAFLNYSTSPWALKSFINWMCWKEPRSSVFSIGAWARGVPLHFPFFLNIANIAMKCGCISDHASNIRRNFWGSCLAMSPTTFKINVECTSLMSWIWRYQIRSYLKPMGCRFQWLADYAWPLIQEPWIYWSYSSCKKKTSPSHLLKRSYAL